MDKKLPRSFRHIQGILKELIDCCQCLLIKLIRTSAVKNLLNEHLAQRNGQLINQTADTQFTVGNDIPFIKKDFTHIESHLGLLVRTAHLFDLSNHRTVCNPDILIVLFTQISCHARGASVNIPHTVTLRQILHHNDIVLVHGRNKILTARTKISTHGLKHIAVLGIFRLNDQRHSFHICLDMKFLRTTVDIHQKQIIQKQILDKVILIKPLLVSYQEILNLKGNHLANHIDIFSNAPGNQDILQLLFVKNLKVLIPLDFLGICRRLGKFRRRLSALLHLVRRHGHRLSIHIHNAQLYPCDRF